MSTKRELYLWDMAAKILIDLNWIAPEDIEMKHTKVITTLERIGRAGERTTSVARGTGHERRASMTEIARLRELLAEALPGPLSIEPHGPGEAVYLGRGPNRHGYNVAHVTEPAHQWPETRALIVAAVNALPSLLGRLEAAEAVVEAAREVSAALVDGADTGGRYWRACDALNAALAAALAEVDRLRAEVCDVLAERDAMQSMATQNGRERNRAEAEAERLTRERDALAVEVAALPYPSDLDRLHEDRDRLAAALAEVREAAGSVFPAAPLDHGRIIPPEHARLFRALAATPADIAAAHDARVRAEALRCAADLWEREEAQPSDGVAAWLRAEAERIGGGR